MYNISNLSLTELYIFARYMYRIGKPVISDADYDLIDRELKANYPDMAEYYNRTYDDDPVPTELLQKCGVEAERVVSNSAVFDSDDYASMNEDKSLSIDSVINYEDAYPFFEMLRDLQLDFVTSLKIDGNNTKSLYKNKQFTMSLSRGRSGDSFDFTESVRKILPSTLDIAGDRFITYSESYVLPEALPILQSKYDNTSYKTCKSAAISLLRVQHAPEDYKYLKTRVFFVDGVAQKLSEMFPILEKSGLETPPYRCFKWSDIPSNFADFKTWLKADVFDFIHDLSEGIPSDGIVVEVDDLLWAGTQKNQYSNRQLALKFDWWDFNEDYGVVKSIRIEQQRVLMSVVLEIEPKTTYDGCTATRINVFNPSILIDNGICVGSTVKFERNSGAVNIFKQ